MRWRNSNAAFIVRPIVSEQPDGSWRARYPEAEWSVTAASSTDAMHKLHAAQLDRLTDPRSAHWQLIALRQHLDHGPVPGVYEIPADRYHHQQRRSAGRAKPAYPPTRRPTNRRIGGHRDGGVDVRSACSPAATGRPEAASSAMCRHLYSCNEGIPRWRS